MRFSDELCSVVSAGRPEAVWIDFQLSIIHQQNVQSFIFGL
jgi:hypothetical protein